MMAEPSTGTTYSGEGEIEQLETSAAEILCQLRDGQDSSPSTAPSPTSNDSTTAPSGKRDLQCTECSKPFPTPSKLNTHLRTHSGERPFTCQVCGKAFRQSSHLRVHERTVHIQEKRHKCGDCGKTFGQAPHLASHQRARHQQERPFVCSTCSRTFVQSNHLTAHERLHSGERPYSCNDCGKSFRQSGHLRIHALTHSGERPHACNDCGARFKQKQHRTKHVCKPDDHVEVVNGDMPVPTVANCELQVETAPSNGDAATDESQGVETSPGAASDTDVMNIEIAQVIAAVESSVAELEKIQAENMEEKAIDAAKEEETINTPNEEETINTPNEEETIHTSIGGEA